jgi:glycosyltransferase involved in cell wall biosynthesis
MKVLFLAPQPFYRLRGMCLAQKRCLEALSSAGCAVRVLAFPFGSDVTLPGLRISRLPVIPFTRDVPIGFSPQKLAYNALLFLYLAVHLPFNRYDVVHACEESAVIAAFFRLFFRFRLVYDMDDVLSARLRKSGAVRSGPVLRAVSALERFALRRADSVLTNSADTNAYAAAHAGRGVVFYDHIPPIPAPSPAGPSDAAGAPLIVYAGNLEPYQGMHLLLAALPEVFGASAARCVVIGGEPAQIAGYSARAAALGLSSRVTWAGKMDIEETFEALQKADVLVSPMCEDKAVPSKVYMYMAAARPIVATDTANHASLLKNGSAVIVQPEPAALARGILEVLSDRALAAALSARSLSAFRSISGQTDVRASLARAYGLAVL